MCAQLCIYALLTEEPSCLSHTYLMCHLLLEDLRCMCTNIYHNMLYMCGIMFINISVLQGILINYCIMIYRNRIWCLNMRCDCCISCLYSVVGSLQSLSWVRATVPQNGMELKLMGSCILIFQYLTFVHDLL